MSIKGWPTQEKDDRLTPQYATVEPVRNLQNALSVLSHQFVYQVGTDTVEASSTTTLINATGHAAQVGDIIRFTSGTLNGQEVKVYSVASNSITLAEELSSAPALGVSFQILRHKYPLVESTGELKISASISSSESAISPNGGALPDQTKVASGYDGSTVRVLKTDSDGELQVDVSSVAGTVDSSNSTTTPLAGGGVFTGVWVEDKNYASLALGLKADQNSATDGVEIQFSNDGATVHHVHNYTYSASGGGIGYIFQPEFKYYRIKYTNGAVAQTSFTLSLTARSVPVFPSQYRVSTAITNETQALMTKSVITGETTGMGGGFINVKVNPSGALTVDATLSALDAALDGQKTMSASLPVVIASDQSAVSVSSAQSGTWNINNISGTVSLPTGAATSANQTTLGSQTTKINDGTNTAAVKAASTAAQATDPALVVAVSPNNSVAITAASLPLPTDAATSTKQSDGSQKTQIVDGSGNVIGSTSNNLNVNVNAALPVGSNTIGNVNQAGTWTVQPGNTVNTVPWLVDLNDGSNAFTIKPASTAAVATDTAVVVAISPNNALSIATPGKTIVNRARNVYTTTSVTTSAYVQLLASTSGTINQVEIFDSSGQTLVLAVGAAGAEVDQNYIFPGGNGIIPLAIASGVRVSIKAVSATANAGEIDINFYS